MSPLLDTCAGGRMKDTALVVLTEWYAAHSAVLRLWAVKESKRLRVILALEPTPDNDDMYPAWLANGREWALDLERRIHVPVQMEVADRAFVAALGAGVGGVLIAELLWRDSSTPFD